MYDSYPEFVVVPLLCWIWLVVFGRLWLANHTPSERWANRILICWGTAATLRRIVADIGFTQLSNFQQALATAGFLLLLLLGHISVLALAISWDTGREGMSSRQRGAIAGLVITAVVLQLAQIAMLDAGDAAQPWMPLAYDAAYFVFPATAGTVMIKICVDQFPHASRLRDRLPLFAVIVVAVVGVGQEALILLAEVLRTAGLPNPLTAEIFTRASGKEVSMYTALGAAAAAAPVLTMLRRQLRVSPEARRSAALRRVWRDLTDAVPEVVLEASFWGHRRLDATTERIALETEIRDAIAILNRYTRDVSGAITAAVVRQLPPTSHPAALAAARLQVAAESRKNGAKPFPYKQIEHDHLHHLDELAAVWSTVRKIVRRCLNFERVMSDADPSAIR
ncbi:hypothetical protein FOS14_13000 [Skermania sp. ID1734]|uniref:DUF6545 domain-containing protein n=1 Tax=Skermania sp. ID1734 TaxID=2597516 RepID=UPI00117C7E88|nr:DUF6545 domain-containing protein [Skermania sp. ID1734]TSD99267.1 hypothetical protein FOS14_13000 [Skermania sp. ID1734]